MTEAKVLRVTVELRLPQETLTVKLDDGWTGKFIQRIPSAINRAYHRGKREKRVAEAAAKEES